VGDTLKRRKRVLEFRAIARSRLFADIDRATLRRFWKFHRENPEIYKQFRQFGRDALMRGYDHYGSKAIMEVIRWHMEIETFGDDFKINNNYTSCYARMLVLLEPEFEGFFRLRAGARHQSQSA
jgi:hypothetical protein